MQFQAEEREKDRIARHDAASQYTASIAELWQMVHRELAEQRKHDDRRTDKFVITMSGVCKYDNRPRPQQ